MLLRLGLGALAAALLVQLPAGPAAAVAGCEDLVLVPRSEGVVRATVPASLGRLVLPSEAFSAVRDGQEVAVQARRLPPSEVAVALLLTSSPDTTPGELEAAQAAMLDLLVNLPPGVRTSLVVGGDPATRVSPLSEDRGAVVRVLSRPDLTGATDAAAGPLALQQLPPEAVGHLVVFTDGRRPVLVPSRSDTQVHRLDYGSARVPQAAPGCPSGEAVALLPAADAVVQRLQGSYELGVPAGSTEVRLSVGGQRLSAPLGAGPGPGPGAGPGPVPGASPSPGRGTGPAVEPQAVTAPGPDVATGQGRSILLTLAFLLAVVAAVVLVRRGQDPAHDGPQATGPPVTGSASPGLLAGLRGRLGRTDADAPPEVDLAARLARPAPVGSGPVGSAPVVPSPVGSGPVVPSPVVPGPVVPRPVVPRPVVPGLIVSSPVRSVPVVPVPVVPVPVVPVPPVPVPVVPGPPGPAPVRSTQLRPGPEGGTVGSVVLLRFGELLDAGRPHAGALRELAGDGQTPAGRQLLRAAEAVDGGADLAQALEATAPRPGAGTGGIRSELGKAAWALRLARSTGARPGLLLKAAARGGEVREAARRAASQAQRTASGVRRILLVLVPVTVAGRLLLGSRAPRPALLIAALALGAFGALWAWASTTPPYSPLPLAWRPRAPAPAPPPPGEVLEDAALWAVINDDVQAAVSAVVADPDSELARTVVREAGVRVRAGAGASEALHDLADEAWGRLLERQPRPVVAALPALVLCLVPAAVLAVLA